MNVRIDFLEEWLQKNGDRFVRSQRWDDYYLDIEMLIEDLKEDLSKL
jgi:hypothetical protein